MATAMQVDTCFQAEYGNHGRRCPFRVDIGLSFSVDEFQSCSLHCFRLKIMWKQNFFTFALYGVILFNAATVLKHIYYRHTSLSSTCSKSDINLGTPVAQSPSVILSRHCGKRLLDGVDTSQGLALGKQREQIVYLSIGIVSTKGEEENLMQALHSLTSHISAAEYSDVVIVVAFEGDQNAAVIQQIKGGFQNELDGGLIQVIYPTGDFLREVNREPLGWKSVTSATDIFKKNTTDFNKRMVFLFEYCHRMSKHYLHLTDQARAIKPYFSVIKQIIDNFEAKNISLYAHDIGNHFLPSLGRLYSAAMLDDLSEYGALFPGGRLPSEIFNVYTFLRPTATVTHLDSFEETLFKMGTRLRGVKPGVEFKSTGLRFEKGHGLEKAFYGNEGFAWLITPKAGDGFIVEFKEPFQMSRVLITTGSPLYRDALDEAVLMACGTTADMNICDQSQCTKIGQFLDPILDAKNLENVVSFPTKCLKMEILSEAKHWVIIREISIWPKE